MSEKLIILGASARAAAFSARRGGFEPVCGDLFADADLRACCAISATDDYPTGLAEIARAAPPGPWLYTGGLENYPKLVEAISRRRPLLGTEAEVLRRVRNPIRVAAALAAAGLRRPELRKTAARLPIDGSWLLKCRRSSGGSQVYAWQGQRDYQGGMPGWYFQRRIEGLPCAAVFVSVAGKATLLGVTRQLLAAGPGGKEFCYAGSIGPWRLTAPQQASFERIGEVLAAAFTLSGLFGVDAILTEDAAWPVEINPRYVASAEVLERACRVSAIALHVAACRERRLPDAPDQSSVVGCHGKAILYADRDVVIGKPLAEEWLATSRSSERPELADVPAAGVRITTGQPVVTLFASGADPDEVGRSLAEQTARRREQLGG